MRPALALTHHLREGAAAGNPPSRKCPDQVGSLIGILESGGVFWTPIYIFFRFNWTRLNGVEPAFYGHILSYWILDRSIERVFGHSKKIERGEFVQFWFNLDYFCTCQIGVIFWEKRSVQYSFCVIEKKRYVWDVAPTSHAKWTYQIFTGRKN